MPSGDHSEATPQVGLRMVILVQALLPQLTVRWMIRSSNMNPAACVTGYIRKHLIR